MLKIDSEFFIYYCWHSKVAHCKCALTIVKAPYHFCKKLLFVAKPNFPAWRYVSSWLLAVRLCSETSLGCLRCHIFLMLNKDRWIQGIGDIRVTFLNAVHIYNQKETRIIFKRDDPFFTINYLQFLDFILNINHITIYIPIKRYLLASKVCLYN